MKTNRAFQRFGPFRIGVSSAIAFALALFAQSALAQYYWDNVGGTANDWGSVANWSTVPAGGTSPAALPGAFDTIYFSADSLAANQTVNLNADRIVTGMVFQETFTHLLQGGGTTTNRILTLGGGGITQNGGGIVTIGNATTLGQCVRIVLGANQTWTNNSTGEVVVYNDISGTGSLNYAGTGVFRVAGFTEAGTTDINSAYTGITTIQSGATLIAQGNSALGATAGGTVIQSGGTLNVGGTLANAALNLGAEAITVSGAGVGGNGAIVNTGSNDQQNAIQGAVTMAGDTTFGGTKRWDIRNASLNGGGFTLTKVGANGVFLSGTSVLTNLLAAVVRQGEFVMETSVQADTTNVTNGILIQPTTATGASFRSWGNGVDHDTTFTLDSTFAGSYARLAVQNGLTSHSGTITATGGDSRLDVYDNYASAVLTGTLAGSGTLRKEGAATLVLDNSSITHTGIFNINNGWVGGTATLGSFSAVNLNNNGGFSPGGDLRSAGVLTIASPVTSTGTNGLFMNLGTTSDRIDAGTWTQDGTTNVHVAYGAGIATGTPYTLIDYSGFGGATGIAGFQAGVASHVAGAITNNTVDGRVELTLTSIAPVVWTGRSNYLWTSGSMTNPNLPNHSWTPSATGVVEYVNNDNARFDDTAAGSTTITTSGAIAPASMVFDNTTRNYSIDGVVIGSGTLAKNGTGTATFLQNLNTTGAITVNAGTLQIGNNNRTASLNGIDNRGGIGVPSVAIAPGATLGVAGGNSTIGANIGGAGGIALNGSEPELYYNTRVDRTSATFTGDNSGFTGTISIADGNRLASGSLNALGNASLVVVAGGGALYLSTAGLNHAGEIRLAGDGWGETTGRLGALRLQNGATVSGNVVLTDRARITAYGSTGTVSGPISGAFAADFGYLNGTNGTITLASTASSYTGETAIRRTTVLAASLAGGGTNSSLGAGDTIRLDDGTLNITGGGAMASDRDIIIGDLGLGGATIGVTDPAATLTLTGSVTAQGPAYDTNFNRSLSLIQRTTAGTGGTVVLDMPATSPVEVAGTTLHRMNLVIQGDTVYTGMRSGYNGSGGIAVGSSVTGDVGDASLAITGNAVVTVRGDFDIGNQGVAASYVVTQSGSSVVNALRGGRVQVDSDNRALRIGHWGTETATYNLSGGAVLNAPNGIVYIGYDGNGTLNQSGTSVLNAEGLRFGNALSSTGAYNLNGGTLNVGATGTTRGMTTTASLPALNLDGGIYRATAGHTIADGIFLNVMDGGATIDTNGFTVGSNSTLLAAGTGAGGVTKTGAGEFVLPTGAATYGGATNINAGTLTLGAAGTNITASTVNVGGGGVLAGLGTVSSPGGVAVAAGGVLSPGLSAGLGNGTLSVSGAAGVTLAAGSRVDVTPAAAGGDLLNVTAALAGATTFNVLPVGATPLAAGTYTLATAGTTAGLVASLGASPHLADGLGAVIATTATAVTVTTSAAADSMVWTGAGGPVWDTTTVNNWSGASGFNLGVAYNEGDVVTFDDGSGLGLIAVQPQGVRPASVTFNNSVTPYVLTGGAITGGGSLAKSGTALAILDNNNSYLGTTTISAGTLQVGNGGTTGTLGQGATTNNATLAFNRSNNSTYAGIISGSGVVRSEGPGTTTLAAANTYAGGTVVSKGTLQGNYNSFGSGTITLNDAATGADNTGLLVMAGTATTLPNAITVTANGTGTVVIGSSERSMDNTATLFGGVVTLDRETTLLGEWDRTTFTNTVGGAAATLTIGRSSGLQDYEMGRVVLEKNHAFTGLASVVVQDYSILEARDISNSPANTAKDQIPDTASVTLGNFSTLQVGLAGTVADSEVIGDLASAYPTSRVLNASTTTTAHTLTFGTASDTTFNGVLNGGNALSFIKQGTGTVTLGGTYDNGNGNLTVNAGTAVLAKDSTGTVHVLGTGLTINAGGTARLGGTYTDTRTDLFGRPSESLAPVDAPSNYVDQIYNNASVTLNAGGFLDMGGRSEVVNGLAGAGTVTNSGGVASTIYIGRNGATGTLTGLLEDGTGGLNLAKVGTGTLTLAGTVANTYSGTTLVQGGTLEIQNKDALGTTAGGTTLAVNGDSTGGDGSRLLFDLAGGSLATPVEVAENFTTVSETYNDRRSTLGNDGTSSTVRLTGGIVFQGDGITNITASQAAGQEFQINGNLTGTSTGTMFFRGTGILVVNGTINVPGAILAKTDTGTLVINSSGNDYFETSLAHGTVRLGVADGLDTGAVLRMGQNNNANTFDLNGLNQTVAGMMLNSGATSNHARAITNSGATKAAFTVNSPAVGSSYIYQGSITGNLDFVKTGPGVQGLGTPINGNSFAYTGDTVIQEGVLKLAGPNLVPDGGSTGNLLMDSGAGTGTLDLNGNNETVNGLHGGGGATVTSNGAGSPTLTVSGTATPATNATFAGVIRNNTDTGTGVLNLAKSGAGTQILSGTNTYTGSTTVAAGTLALSSSGSITPSTLISVASGANFDVSAVTGYTLAAAQTLSGSGSVIGAMDVDGKVNPGSLTGVGTLTTTGAVTFGATSILAADISSTTGSAGLDRLTIGGNLVIDTGADLTFTEVGAGNALAIGTKLVLIDYTLAGLMGWTTGQIFDGYADDSEFVIGANKWKIDYNDTTDELSNPGSFLTLTSVPNAPYATWAASYSLAANSQNLDSDSDGVKNLAEFATDGDPLDPADRGKQFGRLIDLDGAGTEGDVLTLTLAVRVDDGAAFAGATAQSAERDQVTYTIQASNDLTAWTTLVVTDVTGDPEIINGSLPALTSAAWQYRTFRVPGDTSAAAKEFLRATFSHP